MVIAAELPNYARELEYLREEKHLLEARLNETQGLLAETVANYKKQLNETARLGHLLRDFRSTLIAS